MSVGSEDGEDDDLGSSEETFGDEEGCGSTGVIGEGGGLEEREESEEATGVGVAVRCLSG